MKQGRRSVLGALLLFAAITPSQVYVEVPELETAS
jgi:hypothetical protein